MLTEYRLSTWDIDGLTNLTTVVIRFDTATTFNNRPPQPPQPSSKWDSLKAIYQKYYDLPLKESDAVAQGWTKIGSCSNKDKFPGERYILNSDYNMVLIFDAAEGYIAGTQLGTTVGDFETMYPATGSTVRHYFQPEGGHVFQTLYLIPSSSICQATGRTEAEFKEQGIGTVLMIQNGPNADTDYIEVPREVKDFDDTDWAKLSCRDGMGYHMFYQPSQKAEVPCAEITPFSVLHLNGRVHGISWYNCHYRTSRWSEAMPASNLGPRARPADGTFTAQHVYFNYSPPQNTYVCPSSN